MKNQILLVEGKDDLFVLVNIFEKYKVKQSFKLEDKTGIERLLKSLPIYIKTEIDAIGIVIDADANISKRWNLLHSILTKEGYVVPEKPNLNGTILQNQDSPTLGIWIMPNNNESGMLEDFVDYLVPTDDELMPFVVDTLKVLTAKSLNKYKPIHQSKAKIHTWLAWQETPGTPMGLAIKKTYLDTHQDLCVKFVDWINLLYNT